MSRNPYIPFDLESRPEAITQSTPFSRQVSLGPRPWIRSRCLPLLALTASARWPMRTDSPEIAIGELAWPIGAGPAQGVKPSVEPELG